jgi:hypothetical protein
MKLADQPMTFRQQEVLRLMAERFNGRMPASVHAYQLVAREVGWRNSSSVIQCLFSLRAKGLITSVGAMQSKPDTWLLVERATADAA